MTTSYNLSFTPPTTFGTSASPEVAASFVNGVNEELALEYDEDIESDLSSEVLAEDVYDKRVYPGSNFEGAPTQECTLIFF